MGAFVCCVLSHGEKGTVLGVDGKEVEIRELTVPIAECHTLASKPKLFFIQACQGNEGQNGVLTADAPGNATEDDPYDEDAYNPAAHSIPIEADMLIGMATVERYQSYRHTKDGSIYIQELCNQLEKLCPRWVQEETLSCLEWKMHVGGFVEIHVPVPYDDCTWPCDAVRMGEFTLQLTFSFHLSTHWPVWPMCAEFILHYHFKSLGSGFFFDGLI